MKSSQVGQSCTPSAGSLPPDEETAATTPVASQNRQRVRREFLRTTMMSLVAGGGVLAAACGAPPATIVVTPSSGIQGSPRATSGPGSATQPTQANRSLQTARPQKPMY